MIPPTPGYSLSVNAVDEVRSLFGQRPSWASPLLRGPGAYDPGSDYNNCVAQFRNDSGEEIPAFGCIRITDSVIVTGQQYMVAKKPDTYGSQYSHWFNGDQPVSAGKFGMCYKGHAVRAAYDVADGAPLPGEFWGPRKDTWKLRKYTGGWQVIGTQIAGQSWVVVQHAPMTSFTCRTLSVSAKGAFTTVAIYAGSFSFQGPQANMIATGDQLSVYNRYGTIHANRWIEVSQRPQGFEITAGEC